MSAATHRTFQRTFSKALAVLTAWLILGVARLLTGVRGIWSGTSPRAEQTLYFANHTSHGDFVLLWATLPADLRALTRPVAGQDYWHASKLRRFIGEEVFHALMIRRDGGTAPKPDADGITHADGVTHTADVMHGAGVINDTAIAAGNPVQQMVDALLAGDSLIMFPEGTRNTGEDVMLPLKSGLYHLACACPQARLVPVWIENLKRVLPKGMLVPIPLACTVRYGAPIALAENEDKASFMARARAAMLALRPEYDQDEKAR